MIEQVRPNTSISRHYSHSSECSFRKKR